jgi:hypothetical protein
VTAIGTPRQVAGPPLSKEDAMKKWPWVKILFSVSCLLVLLGVAPLAFAIWEVTQSQPLSEPLTLKRGEYGSPYFRTYLGGDYQVQLGWLRFPDAQAMVDLDWKIVDDSGTVIQHGTYSDRLRGANNLNLGEYRPKFGLRQRIITTVHQDVQGDSANATLQIGQPEISLDMSYGFFLFLGWAGVVGGPGVVMLCILLVRRITRHKSPTNAS